ncbi:MAG TPA: hypothetical protein VKP30_24260 [Polyangiaceae bacterium]|nr:hypothetical protein [Polyangiaceae bacterium]
MTPAEGDGEDHARRDQGVKGHIEALRRRREKAKTTLGVIGARMIAAALPFGVV